MTVKELKEIIKDLPGDQRLWCFSYDKGLRDIYTGVHDVWKCVPIPDLSKDPRYNGSDPRYDENGNFII